MSTTFELELSGPVQAEHLTGAMHAVAAQVGLGSAAGASGTAPPGLPELELASGLTAYAMVRQLRQEDVLARTFGVESAATVGLEVARDHDYESQVQDMVRIVAGLLGTIPNDAVLHYEIGTVWLVRRGGVLTLSDQDDLWTPARLQLIPGPYQRGPLTVA